MLRPLSCSALVLTSLTGTLAQASSDYICSPTWTLNRDQLDNCSNLPFLSPGNDSRVNLKLMLADTGHLALPSPLLSSDFEQGYAQVPFSLEMLNEQAPEEAVEQPERAKLRRTHLASALQQSAVQLTDLALTEQAFAEGEGSRCRSNNFDSARLFINQLNEAQLQDHERSSLAQARTQLLALCSATEPAPSVTTGLQLSSPLASAFAHYLQGAQAFYQGDFTTAQQTFSELAANSQPWLAETARYMQARTALNQAQLNAFDEYGYVDLSKVEAAALNNSQQLFDAYLAQYPQGLYADSARGLLRRLYWLSSNHSAYAQALAEQLAKPNSTAHRINTLIDELESKELNRLQIDQVTDPQLLAMLDLLKLRRSDEPSAQLSREQLLAQKDRFNQSPELHQYLLAAWYFYSDKDPAKTLGLLPENSGDGALNLLQFSQQTLRGLALEASDPAQALSHWKNLLKRPLTALQQEQTALAWALNQARQGQLEALFAEDSPFTSAPARLIVLNHQAAPELLRKQAQNPQAARSERDAALDTLLSKELLFGRYADFQSDQALIKQLPHDTSLSRSARFTWSGSLQGYRCPSLSTLAKRLQDNPQDPNATLCLGEFVRNNGFDGVNLNEHPPADQLGGAPSQFSGTQFSRLNAYQALIDQPKAPADERAYALYRAIYCFAPASYNNCDSQEISEQQRKLWFQTLKRQYGQSVWAQKLKYYW